MEKIISIEEDKLQNKVKNFLENELKVFEHSERVRKISREIVDRMDSDDYLDVELLYKAAWLHDIGRESKIEKRYKKENHHIESVIAMKQLFECEETKTNMNYVRKLESVIIAHKGEFKLDKDIAMEAAILRMADKIDKYNKSDIEDADDKYEKSLKKIEGICDR